jgi:hypothetical protein
VPTVLGEARVEPYRQAPYVERLVGDDGDLAWLGRHGWMRVFFGPGQRIGVAGGEEWRLRAVGSGPYICPVVMSPAGKLAVASPGIKNYLITGPDWAYALNPADGDRWRRARWWTLRVHEQDVALFTRQPSRLDADTPIPLPAVVLCLMLMRYGIPGEADLNVPSFKWA